ncbi:hypothetical protein CH063_14683 [Colletotrichum higginsianum]|uniref:Uncharacterized protein n=1 Tax=Colletotrichum higginsianum (strain IMI 349063) TaxID=759273 RepID=H1VZK2_COLHI|nr:hypothetical protein CH063_14683 [Colletotrichum higginsianum]
MVATAWTVATPPTNLSGVWQDRGECVIWFAATLEQSRVDRGPIDDGDVIVVVRRTNV